MFSSMESLNTLEAARRLSDAEHHNSHPAPSRAITPTFRGRPPGHRPFHPGHPRSPHPHHGPPWPQGPAGRPSLSSPRVRAPSAFSPRGSPRGFPRGRYQSPRGGRQPRAVSCPRRTNSNTSSPLQPSTPVQVSSAEVDSNSDSELTEVPFSPVTAESKLKNGKGRASRLTGSQVYNLIEKKNRKWRIARSLLHFKTFEHSEPKN